VATFLDIGFLRFFLPVFTFLFVLVLIKAMLGATKLLGESSNLQWIASISVATIVLFSTKSIELINFITPWFVILFVFLFLLFILFLFLGGKEKEKGMDEIWSMIGGKNTIVIVAILILAIAIGQVFQGTFDPYSSTAGTKTIGGETVRALFNPRILGAIFLIIVAAFAVGKISQQVVEKN